MANCLPSHFKWWAFDINNFVMGLNRALATFEFLPIQHHMHFICEPIGKIEKKMVVKKGSTSQKYL